MRIQHNIMAMNAYRNYNNNNKALSGNLEKLSSGYKINRAGDDAAGLAISEKMRAQITGLEAAQKNVKDGISLVKTAEGAMQEIQDMLNRMDYLATQSANGTYQDEVDREALQKEVDQLKEEINRIAESANFNGIKLLDGTWDADGKEKAVADAQAALDAANAALEEAKAGTEADPIYGDPMDTDDIIDLMLPLNGDGPNGPTDVGNKTVLETEKIEYQRPSFQVSFNGVKHTMATASVQPNGAATGGSGAITMTVNGVDVEITEQDIAEYLQDRKLVDDEDIKDGLVVDGETLAAVFAKKIKDNGTFNDGVGGTGGDDWNVRADGENLVFEYASSNGQPATTLNKYYDVKITPLTALARDATGGVFTTGTYTAGTSATAVADTKITVNAKINGEDVTFSGSAAADAAANGDMLTAIKNAEAKINGKLVRLSDYFDITESSSQFTLTSIATGKDGDSIEKFTLTPGAITATGSTTHTAPEYTKVAKKDGWEDGENAYTPGTTGYLNAGTEVPIAGVPAESEQLASTTLDFSDLDIVDGMKIKLGDTEYTFAVGADSKYADAENVVDLTSTEAKKLLSVDNGGDQTARNLALSKLAEAAKDNETFTVSHEANGNGTTTALDQIGLKQKAEVKETTDMSTMENFASYISISTVDTDATEAAQKELDDAQPELIAKAEEEVKAAQEALDSASAGAAKALNLQIGDTSDSYNQLGVKIGSMKTDAMKITDLSVATADDAAGAIDVIKDAINYVSSVRGDLGAYQNRLDHTANNLSVMAENIQDAESTIRDTDVAEEMMSYVKNNILVQSAQAMLAQANQLPQGVLQLLG